MIFFSSKIFLYTVVVMRVCETTHGKVRYKSDSLERFEPQSEKEIEIIHAFYFQVVHCTMLTYAYFLQKWQTLFVLCLCFFFCCCLSSSILSHNLFWWKACACVCVCMYNHTHSVMHPSVAFVCNTHQIFRINELLCICFGFFCFVSFTRSVLLCSSPGQASRQTCLQLYELFSLIVSWMNHLTTWAT